MSKWTVEQILKIQRIIYETDVYSLNTKISDEDDAEFGEFVIDDRDAFEEFNDKYRNEQLRKLIRELDDPRSEQILCLRFGLYDGVYKTLDDIGKRYNVTRERVRQLESKALKKLIKLIKQKGLKYEDFI